MKNFLKMLFASILGVFIAMFFVWIIFIGILAAMLSGLGSGSKGFYSLTDNTMLKIVLEGNISDRKTTDFLPGLFGPTEKSTGLDDIMAAIKTAKENDKIPGIYIKTGNLSAGIASLEPIRNALVDFRESGKFIVAYGDYYTQSAYYISSVADKVIMNPQGMFMFHGMSSYYQFNKGLYDKLGIKFEAFRVGTFKAAIEPYTETRMSEENREQTSSFINCVWEHLLAGISKSRGIPVEKLNLYADEYMTYSAPEKSVEYGFVDDLMYESDMDEYIKNTFGLTSFEKMRYATVANINSIPEKKSLAVRDRIAVLYAEGMIIQGKGSGLSPLLGNIITDEEYVKEIGKLKNDNDVKAVVLRINSPGGSAYASEQIWHAVTELKKEKPVIVSMGDAAASGGYYIACAADMIIAEPTTLTGSIGGFALVPVGEELHKKIGLTFDGVKTNKHSDMETASLLLGAKINPYTDDERRIVQAYINRFIDVFYTRCADGRAKTKEEIDAIGQGRIWTGTQALQNGLVDRLGSLEDAIKIAAQQAQLTNYEIDAYPKVKDPLTILLEEMMNGNVKASLIRSMLGDDVFRLYMTSNKRTTPLDFVQALMIE